MAVLLVGYKAGDLNPKTLAGDEVVVHTLDIYHRHAIEKVFHGQVKVVCTPHLPDGDWDEIRFLTGPKLMSGELALDLLQEIRGLLMKRFVDDWKKHLHLDYVGRERDRNDLLDKVTKDGRVRSFAAEWPASVPGGNRLMFTSYPGCFCHRRLDEGGLALAEVVVRELKSKVTNKEGEPPLSTSTSSLHLLDMGCGCGLVGLLIGGALGDRALPSCGGVHLVMVDSHSRAVEAATVNAKKFGIEAEVIISDNGSPERMDGTFDIFVGNPPYYSDYRIADVFLETAKRALKPGGVCYTVCKNAAGLEPVQKKYFPEVEIIPRRNYAVLKSVKMV